MKLVRYEKLQFDILVYGEIIMKQKINPRFFTVKTQDRSCLGITTELYLIVPT